MVDCMKNDNKIMISVHDSDLYFKPLGHITANVCFPLRDMVFKRITEITKDFSIFIDLSETDYMDSTFLGLLAGIEKRLFKTHHTHAYILNPNSVCLKLLSGMGLDKFLIIKNEALPETLTFKIFDDDICISELEKSKIVLSSHKELSSLSEENKKKFRVLEQVLEEQINGTDN